MSQGGSIWHCWKGRRAGVDDSVRLVVIDDRLAILMALLIGLVVVLAGALVLDAWRRLNDGSSFSPPVRSGRADPSGLSPRPHEAQGRAQRPRAGLLIDVCKRRG